MRAATQPQRKPFDVGVRLLDADADLAVALLFGTDAARQFVMFGRGN